MIKIQNLNDSLKIFLLTISSCLLLFLSSLPYNLGFLNFVSFVPIFYLIRKPDKIYKKLLITFSIFFIYSCINQYFNILLYKFLLYLLINFSIALILTLLFILIDFLDKYFSKINILLPSLLWFIIEFILNNYFKTVFSLAFNIYSYSWVIQSASILGVSGVSLFIVLVNRIIYLILIKYADKIKPGIFLSYEFIAGIVIITGLLCYNIYYINKKPAIDNKLNASLISTGIPTEWYINSWRYSDFNKKFNDVILPLLEKAKNDNSEMVILPENAFFNVLFRNKINNQFLKPYINKNKIYIFGADDIDADNNHFNSAFIIDVKNKKTEKYDKVNNSFLDRNTYKSGNNIKIFDYKNSNYGVGICMDLFYPDFLQKLKSNNAELFILLSNFAVLKNTSVHFYFISNCIFRAIENGIYLIASTNNCFTLIVDEHGNIQKISKFAENTVINGNVFFIKGKTIYNYIYPYILYIIIAFSFIVFTINFLIKRLRNNKKLP